MITKDTSIEEIVDEVQGAVEYLMKKGIRCIVCGEPIWGTLEEACEEKGFSASDIEGFVQELNQLAQNPPQQDVTGETKIDVKPL
jgi:methionine synthase II (cobalamin-independent)